MVLPATDKVTAFTSSGESGALAVVIPKTLRLALGIKAGDKFKAIPIVNGKNVFVLFVRISKRDIHKDI